MMTIETLRAVYHPTRRRIIDYLFLHGPSRVGALAAALEQQVGSISHHLRMLERVGVVVRARDLETDGRTSWWRLVKTSLSWSVEDFADSPADRTQARVAERLNLDLHFRRLAAWKKSSDGASERWRRAAFSSDTVAMATPEELDALNEALIKTWRDWWEGIDTDDGQDRRPVFVFAHGFPTDP